MVDEPWDLLTAREVAKRLSISSKYVYDLVGRGELQGVRIGRLVRFRLEDIEDFIQHRTSGFSVHLIDIARSSPEQVTTVVQYVLGRESTMPSLDALPDLVASGLSERRARRLADELRQVGASASHSPDAR